MSTLDDAWLFGPRPVPLTELTERELLARVLDVLEDTRAALAGMPAPQVRVETPPFPEFPAPVVTVPDLRDGPPVPVVVTNPAGTDGPEVDLEVDEHRLGAVPVHAAPLLAWNGTRWVRMRGNNADGLRVQVSRIENRVVVSGPLTDAQLRASAVPVAMGSDTKDKRLDYDTRTDGNPVYVGEAASQADEAVAVWTIQKLAYDSSARLTFRQVRQNVKWSERTTLNWT